MISSKIKKFLQDRLDLIVPIALYLLITLLVWPFGEHAVNDDWQFYTHVRYFSEGNLIKNPLIDSSFILQGFIGVIWSKIFGLSFVSLRILTIFCTLFFIVGVYKILKHFNLSRITIILTFISIYLEPLFITSSFSFMTEIYFLTFCIWSIYYFIKGTESQNQKLLLISLFLGSLTLLIRQFGIVLLPIYLIYIKFRIINKDIRSRSFIATIIFFLTSLVILISFPQYSGDFSSKYDKLIWLLGSLKDVFIKFGYYLKYLIYISFYLAPITFSVSLKNSKFRIISCIVSIFLTFLIFTIDIFDLGNVFHIECIYCEQQFKNRVSLFDNIFYKLLISYILSLNLVLSFFKLYESRFWKSPKDLVTNPFLAIAFGMFFIIILVDSFYERYFINFAVLFIIFLAIKINNLIKPNKLTWCICFLFLLIITFLNLDFYKTAEIKWKQSMYIRDLTGKNGEIFTLGSFYRFILAKETSPEKLVSAVYSGKNDCYIKTYFSSEKNLLGKILERQKYGMIENPVFTGEKFVIEIPKISKNMENIITFQEYSSPIYSLLGIRTAVSGFCESNVINEFKLPTLQIENFNF